MRTEFTVTAKTVSEAYTKAIELYASLGDITHEVISEGKPGFLGIFGRKDAVIKVIVDDGREEKKPKIQTQDGTKAQEKPRNNQNNNQNNNPQRQNQQKAENKPKNDSKQNNNNKPKAESPKAESKPKTDAPKAENKPKADNKPKAQSVAPKQETGAEKSSNDTRVEALKEENINVTVEEKTLAMNFLKSFIKDIGLNCEVKGDMTLNENGFVSRLITIEGEGAPSLIGHRGDMLDALQYLANLCLARKSEGDHKEYVKVIIDIENYREKREQALRSLARRMAEKAIKYQRNVLLEPMNPYERMIIHSEVQGIEGVSTHSVGYDDNRKIVITCDNKKRKPYNKNK